MKKTIITIVIVLIVGIGIYLIASNNNLNMVPVNTSQLPPLSVSNIPISIPTPVVPVSNNPEHCGGNIKNPPMCGVGYHCAPVLGSHLPFGDVGGTCVAN